MKHKFWLRCCAAVLAAGALLAGGRTAPAARAAAMRETVRMVPSAGFITAL